MLRSIAIPALFSLLASLASAQYTATYTWGQLPDKTEGGGQTGTNSCGTQSSPSSKCQNVVVNSANDFCIWGPPDDSKRPIGAIEQVVVAYCLNEGYGTRLIPSGTITNAHFVRVMSDKVSYVQVTGNGDFTKIGRDDGGELDPHSWTGLGNPEGGLVFTNAFTGQYEQTHEWTSFQSSSNFCIRACRDGPNAANWCQHIYDVLGCGFTIPGSFDGGFDDCNGDPAEQPGVYGGSTFRQDDPSTPAPHPAGPTSQCRSFNSIGGGNAGGANLLPTITGMSSSRSSASASSSGSVSSSVSASNSSSASVTSSASSSSASISASASASASSSGMTTSRSIAPSSSASGAAAIATPSTSQAAGMKVGTAGGAVGVMGAVGALMAVLL